MQVTKGVIKYSRDPSKLMGTYETEVYFITKNRDILNLKNAISHTIYRSIEAVAWGIRTKNPLVILYGIAGIVKGFIRGGYL
jgi:hypothetical protein